MDFYLGDHFTYFHLEPLFFWKHTEEEVVSPKFIAISNMIYCPVQILGSDGSMV